MINAGNVRWNMQRLKTLLLLCLCALPVHRVFAYPFPLLDARSAGMGGVGVAADYRNAPSLNPSLSASEVENVDWMVFYPVNGNLKPSSDDFENNLSITNAPQEGDQYGEYESSGLAIMIPSKVLSGFAFANERFFHSAEILGSGGNQIIRHRSVSIKESGFSLSRVMQEPGLPLYGFRVGGNIKLVQYKSYGYDTSMLSNPQLAINGNKFSDGSSAINFDIGLSRELGVWKLGFALKDIFRFDREYGDSGDQYKVSPQARMGMAYQSRKTFWGIDVDLSKNTEVAGQSETQYVAFGWEYRLIKPLFIRFGVRSNSVGDKSQTTTAGVGLHVGMFEFDFAGVKNDDDKGMFSRLLVKF